VSREQTPTWGRGDWKRDRSLEKADQGGTEKNESRGVEKRFNPHEGTPCRQKRFPKRREPTVATINSSCDMKERRGLRKPGTGKRLKWGRGENPLIPTAKNPEGEAALKRVLPDIVLRGAPAARGGWVRQPRSPSAPRGENENRAWHWFVSKARKFTMVGESERSAGKGSRDLTATHFKGKGCQLERGGQKTDR